MARTKKEIRARVLEKRQALTREEIYDKSSRIIERLREREEYRLARVLLAYVPFRGEVDIEEVLRNWTGAGRRLLLPATDWERCEICPVEVLHYPEDLRLGRYGILEPAAENHNVQPELEQIDLVLVPGVAFDEKGFRLGYGQGFYDRFLSRLPDQVKVIGLAYEFQVVDTVFPEPHDQALPAVITEQRVIEH